MNVPLPAPLPFLSVVALTHNHAPLLRPGLACLQDACCSLSSEWQLIVVDNGSTDDSVAVLRDLAQDGMANLQVLALAASVDLDTAAWAGLDRAIGDAAIVLDLGSDDLHALPGLMAAARQGADLVFAHTTDLHTSRARALLSRGFYRLYRWSAGVDLNQAPRYRLLGRRVLNHLNLHPSPAAAYRHLGSGAGFTRAHLQADSPPNSASTERPLQEDLSRAWTMLMNSGRGPMRVVSGLSLLSAALNLAYSAYVIAVAVFKAQVQPGWVTLSLQNSGMFLLLSLTLLVLGEYVLHITRLTLQGPAFLIAQEFDSGHFTRQAALNIHAESGNHLTGTETARA